MSDHGPEPWWKHWGAIAAGILFIGLAVAYGVGGFALPQIGQGIGNFFGFAFSGVAQAANYMGMQPRTFGFTLAFIILAIGTSIAAVRYLNSR